MPLPLYRYDIDKYISWYRKLTHEINNIEMKKQLEYRYVMVSYGLHARYIVNNANLKSRELSDEYLEKSKILNSEIKSMSMYVHEACSGLFFLPTFSEWLFVDTLRKAALETDKERYSEKLKISPLPEIEVARRELERVESENRPQWLEYAENGTAIYNQKEMSLSSFAIGIAFIDYAKYLQNIIEEHAPSTETAPVLEWKGTMKELSELIKALILVGAIPKPEKRAVEVFSKVFGIDLVRHSVNVNELQSVRKVDLFMAKMYKEMKCFLDAKLD